MSDPTPDPIEEMNKLHIDLGRKAANKAMDVLESLGIEEIPVATAVALLKFGVELERKALLGTESDDGDAVDPFANLAKQLEQGQQAGPEKEE